MPPRRGRGSCSAAPGSCAEEIAVMFLRCDICGEEVQPGQPRFAAEGDGGSSGAPEGYGRHWKCHEAKYGRAMRSTVDARPEHRG